MGRENVLGGMMLARGSPDEDAGRKGGGINEEETVSSAEYGGE